MPKVPKVKGTKMTITCFGPAFIGLKMGFPILLNYLLSAEICGLIKKPAPRDRTECRAAKGSQVLLDGGLNAGKNKRWSGGIPLLCGD